MLPSWYKLFAVVVMAYTLEIFIFYLNFKKKSNDKLFNYRYINLVRWGPWNSDFLARYIILKKLLFLGSHLLHIIEYLFLCFLVYSLPWLGWRFVWRRWHGFAIHMTRILFWLVHGGTTDILPWQSQLIYTGRLLTAVSRSD